MMICIQRKEPIFTLEKKMQMTTDSSLNVQGDDKHKEEFDEDDDCCEFFFSYEDQPRWYEKDQRWGYSVECVHLDGGIAPPPPWIFQPDSPSPVADHASFITKDRYVNPSLVADRAAHEVFALALDKDGLFWTNDGTVLNQQHYQQTFPRPNPTPPPTNSWTHASRASAVVNMEHTQLVKLLTSELKWTQLFPSIVSEAIRFRFLRQGSSYHNPDGSLQLMHTKLQAPTLYVPKRAFCFLRTFKEIDPLTWVVADMSIDSSRNIGYPCGCLIRGLANGYSQVIWVEHLTFEESYMDHKLYTDLSRRGFAFGAQRWVDCLERSCERRSYQTKTGFLVPCLVAGQEDPCQYEKKCVMELTQKMVCDFCSHIHPTDVEGDPTPRISCVPALRNMQICVSLTQSPYQDYPKEMVLISVTTFSLPHSPEFILEILGDEDRRHEWDVSGKICPLQKPTCYTTGIDSRNKISLYQTCSWFGDQVVLQEASVNRSGSLLVWSVLKRKDFAAIDECIPRLPVSELSGLAISSNSHPNTTSSSNTGGGSIVTLAVHQVARDIKELEQHTIDFAKKHIRKVALSVEAVLNESAKRTSPEEVCGVCGSSRLLQQTNKRLKQYS